MRSPILTAPQVRSFHRDGFLALPDFFDSTQHEQIRGWFDEIASWNDDSLALHYHELTDAGPAPARTEQFADTHDGMNRLFTRGRLMDAVGQLFGEPARLFKEKINYKYPGGAGFAPHQDATAYKGFGTLQITALIAVDENTIDNGCLWFSPGAHRNGGMPDDGDGCLGPQIANSLDWVPLPLPAGGVALFGSFVPHKSGANTDARPRRSIYVSFSKDSEGDLRAAYYRERRAFMEREAPTRADGKISRIGHFQGKVVQP